MPSSIPVPDFEDCWPFWGCKVGLWSHTPSSHVVRLGNTGLRKSCDHMVCRVVYGPLMDWLGMTAIRNQLVGNVCCEL
jgi:hypothetical protein